MKILLILSLSLISVLSSPFLGKNLGQAVPSAKQDIIDFTIGFMVSIKLVEKVPDGFPCVTNLEDIRSKISQAIALIRTRDADKVAQGISLIQNTINETLRSCGAAANEGNLYFHNLVKEIINPGFIAKAIGNFKANFFEIFGDFNKGISDLKNNSFFNSGVDFGNVFNLILNGKNNELELYLINEIGLLGSINWPFNNCGSGPLTVSGVTLDSQPAKGTGAGITVQGTANDNFTLEKVQITTLLNGNNLNTQFDPNTNAFTAGAPFSYHFAVSIPSFAPSVNPFFF